MLYIVDKLDELRNGHREENRNSPDLPRIQYWGSSYGTALGNYFASMFPGRVERMLLEGVVDVEDWVAGVSVLPAVLCLAFIFKADLQDRSIEASWTPQRHTTRSGNHASRTRIAAHSIDHKTNRPTTSGIASNSS